MGKLARINAARKSAGLPVDDNGYYKVISLMSVRTRGKSIGLRAFIEALKGETKCKNLK